MIATPLRTSVLLLIFVFGAFGVRAEQAEVSLRDLRSQIDQINRAIEKAPPVADPSRREATAANMATLVEKRNRLVEKLIRTNPQAARSVLMRPALVDRLNKEAPLQAAEMEEAGEWSGTLEATVADDFEHGLSTTQWYLHSGDIRRELFFMTPQNLQHQIHRQVAVAGIGTSQVIAVESFRPEIQTGESGPPGLNCTPTGTENVAVLIMNQPSGGQTYPSGMNSGSYWQSIYFGSTAKSANNYWQESSFNLTSGTGTVYTTGTSNQALTFSSNENCTNYDQLATDALAVAKADGIDFSNFSRISIVYPINSCSFGGLGSVGCYPADGRVSHPYSITWIPILSYYTTTSYAYWGLIAHELGHNLGLHHSSSLNFGSIPLGAIDYNDPYPNTGTAGPGLAVRTEYGDPYTVMGNGSWTCGGQYTAFNKAEFLTWMSRTSDVQEVTTTGSFQVVPLENSSGLRGLRILRDPLTSSWIWMEYRQALGDYDSYLSTCDGGSNVLQGANVYYESPYSEDGHLFLLDMNAATTPNNFNQGTMVPGSSWSDPYSLLTLLVTAANSTGVSISTSYDQPCATLAISSGVFSAAGGSGTITVTAPNTCSWTASTVDGWITITSGSSGTGNGTVNFTLSSNTSNNQQRNGYITVQRQSVPVAQKGAATFVSSLSPVFQSGLSSVLHFTFNDPAGANDISYFITKVHGTDCEVETEQSGGNWYMFLLDPVSYTFSSSIQPGQATTASNNNCTLNGATSTITTNGNQLQLGLSLSFQQSFAGSYRVTAAVCDGRVTSNCPDVSIGTYQVGSAPPPPVISTITPNSGKQGATVPITIAGSNTHFTNASTIGLTGTGVTVSAISASSGTQLSATLTIARNATAGSQTLTVTSGAEVVTGSFTINASGQVQLSASSLTFAKQLEQTTSAAQQVTLTNNGTTTLNIAGITPSTNFGESDNCGTSLPTNASCTLNITFTPTLAGTLTGTITISDDSPTTPQVIGLTGLGDLSITPGRPTRPTRP
ncbi:MAG TPA: choice-of-anchor D domain-containing protein [Terriglobales bacterium]|nr:choice-of-anchor D domain-containing protein [Terriglobales bacterium]